MITFLGDVALISDDLQSEYKPAHPYVFNLEYVIKADDANLLPTRGKINLASQSCAFESIFDSLPIATNVVNNHIYDFGEDGFQSTLSKTEELGIVNIKDEPVFLTERICVFSYMLLDDNGVFRFDYERAKVCIEKAKDINPDARIVVQMHWGIENSPTENEEQKSVGRWLIDNGADLVIGHHPHCIQPVEEYKGKMIFYSLGNTLFGNISVASHYDENYTSQRVYRFKWQRWNRKSVAVNYDEETNAVTSIDYLYQKKNMLMCKKRNISPDRFIKETHRLGKFVGLRFKLRKYYLFFVSNVFVDGKLFDMSAIKHELRGK